MCALLGGPKAIQQTAFLPTLPMLGKEVLRRGSLAYAELPPTLALATPGLSALSPDPGDPPRYFLPAPQS